MDACVVFVGLVMVSGIFGIFVIQSIGDNESAEAKRQWREIVKRQYNKSGGSSCDDIPPPPPESGLGQF